MEKQPIKLYFFITFVLFVSLIYFGISLKNFLNDKVTVKDLEVTKDLTSKTKERINYAEPDPTQQAKAIWSLAVIVFIIFSILYLLFKLVNIRSSRII